MTWGDLDGYGSHYDFYPELNLGFIMLTSSGGKDFIAFHNELERFLVGLPALKEIVLSKKELKNIGAAMRSPLASVST